MALLRGKQIDGIQQRNMGITTSSIIENNSVTNKEYVITRINDSSQALHYSRLNIDMDANAASVGDLACSLAVIEFPISNILVKLNGQLINTGVGLEAYFSPDGITIRDAGNAQKGDYLYWNDSTYNLTADDSISFDYLVVYDRYLLDSGTTAVLDPVVNTLVVEYDGVAGTTMTVTIDGVNFTVGNVGGAFVWDIGGADEHTFTSTNEAIKQIVNGSDYTIWFDGFGSLIFSVSKGNFVPEILFSIGTGFDDVPQWVIKDSNGKYVIGGRFTSYNGITANRIIRLNQDGSVDTTFNSGTGFNSYVYTITENSNGKYVVGGWFSMYNGTFANSIIVLNQDGSIDTSFVYGSGFNGNVSEIIQDSNGKYVIVGGFTTYKGVTSNRIIRLNQDGSKDTSFGIGTGTNNYVIRAIYQDTNGKYVIGGDFTTYNGLAANRIIRLNQDGSKDTAFVYGTGFDSDVYTIMQDSNGKYVIGGSFYSYNSVMLCRIARLNQDGSRDTTFLNNQTWGGTVYKLIQDTNGKYVAGGYFTNYNGTTINNILRLNYDSSIDTTFNIGTGFDMLVYSLIENANTDYIAVGFFTSYNSKALNYIISLKQSGDSNTVTS